MTGALDKSNLWIAYEDAVEASANAYQAGNRELGTSRARVAEVLRRVATR